MAFKFAALAAAAIAATAGAAQAKSAAGDIADVRSFDMEVRGKIAQRCSMGAVPNMHFGDLERAGLEMAASVQFNCNIPLNMSIRAQNGALTHSQLPSGQGPYSGALPYRVGLAMPIRRPQSSVIARSFEGRELRGAGANISSEGGIAVDGLALNVTLGRPSGEAGLLAGQYGETIEVTITPN